jgi:uncharacterized protein YbbC (DUF1343 family)
MQIFLKKYSLPVFICSAFFLHSCSKKISNHNIFIPKTEISKIDSLPKNSISDTIIPKITYNEEIIKTGSEVYDDYLPLLEGKKVAIVTNQTGIVKNKHIVDFLMENKVNLKKIFSPEHGFRGNIERGTDFSDYLDPQTGIPVVALYGKNKKPSPLQLKDIDIVIFDIQDIGVRFFTYISTLHYVMEACAENEKTLIILDKPNPLGDYFDGPVLEPGYKSFVGMHPIPVVHGLTVGELALMINGESWLNNGIKCDVVIIKCQNYNHSIKWSLKVKPSPNLPDDLSIRLYPSLCFFEATEVSIGRGTLMPFQIIGYPGNTFGDYTFIPEDIEGMQTNPVQEGKICRGITLQNETLNHRFTLYYFLKFADSFNQKADMITNVRWLNLLAGTDKLYHQIISGMSEADIRKTWQKDLNVYKEMRKKYLLYPDFE